MTDSSLTPERWAEVNDLFARASDMPIEERQAFLQGACSDPSLREIVQRLLDAAEVDDAVLEGAVKSAAESFATTTLPFERLGPYELSSCIGQGGMGSVYLARRADDQFQQQVAIKVLDRHRVNPDLITRFRGERQILAELDHPNVARLLDGGETPDGAPYLVMEYVDGTPIDQYCDEHALTLKQRLQLFQQVCDAVQHAHQHLIVHRDIKPSNILVTQSGTPKLLDFGIAKILAPETAQHTVAVTVAEMRLLTPQNASPEQITGGRITTASDVYALGVLLYRLLSGHFPFDDTATSRHDLYRAVLETEPARPSTAVRTATPDNPPASISIERLRRELSGDLDAIVMVALRREPERRYGTVRQLSEDIDRHLNHLPVRARKGQWTYRAQKFLQRHRTAIASGVLVVATVATLVTFYTLRLTEQRNVAEREREAAEQISSFVVDIFKVSDPSESRGNTITAREILDRGAQKIDDSLIDQPLVKARMASVLGEVHYGLGLYPEAQQFAARAIDLQTAAGDNPVDIARERESMANAMVYNGELEAALQEFEEILATRQEYLGDDHAETLNATANLSDVLLRMGRGEEGARLCADALPRARLLDDVAVKTWVMICHANGLSYFGDTEAAVAITREAADLQLAAWGEDDPIYLASLNNLAAMLSDTGDFVAAIEQLTQVIEIRERVFGPEHRHVVEGLISRGSAYRSSYQLEPAIADADRALAIIDKGIEDSGLLKAHVLYLKGLVLNLAGDFDEAEAVFLDTLEVGSVALARPHVLLASATQGLAGALRGQSRYDEALQYTETAFAEIQELFGPNHFRSVAQLHHLANIFLEKKEYDAALQRVDDGMARATLTDDQYMILEMQLLRAKVLAGASRFEETNSVLDGLRADLVEQFSEDNVRYGNYAELRADAEAGLGRHQLSLKPRIQSLEIFEKFLGADHARTATARLRLARSYHASGDHEQAREHAERSVAALQTALGPDHADVLHARAFLNSLGRD